VKFLPLMIILTTVLVQPASSAARPVIEVERYGAKLDGATDDSAALRKALAFASSVGGLVHIPSSSSGMAIASSALPIIVSSRTGLIGDGMGVSRILVTGSGSGHLFKGTNVRSFYVSGISFTGNGIGATIDQAAAFNFQQDASATAVGGDIRIENCRFSNFTSYYWLWFRNTGNTYTMDDISVRGNVFQSVRGNTIGPYSIGPSSYLVSVEGQSDWEGSGSIGLVRNVHVDHNWADANYVKGFGAAWESTRDVYYTDNVVINAGQANGDDAANYAFLIYNNGRASRSPNPDYVYIERNVITAPRDAGVYSAMHDLPSGNLFVRDNTITRQNSTATGTIPKGAIAINGAALAIIEGNVVDSCFWGIAAIGQFISQATYIRHNRVTNAAAAGQSIYVQPTLTGSAALFSITDNQVSTSNARVRAIFVTVTTTAGISKLVIERNFASSAYLPIEESSAKGVPLLGEVSISDNECNGQNANGGGIEAASLESAHTHTTIVGNRFTGTWSAKVSLLHITSATRATPKTTD